MINKLSDSKLDSGSEINSQNEISNNIRKLLQTRRSISFDNYGEQKVYTVVDGEDKYRFYNDRGDWKMEIINETESSFDYVDLYGESDISFLQELFKQDLTDEFRELLKTKRVISFGEYGEQKIYTVVDGDTKYEIYNTMEGWKMNVADQTDNSFEFVSLFEDSDIDFLEELFKQDISESLRSLLLENFRVLDTDNLTFSVQENGIEYRFYADSTRQYASYAMDTFDHEGNFIASIDIREESDVLFLEQLFRNFHERDEIVSGVRKDVTDI